MKTYVFDASALYVFLQNKPAANKVSQLLKEAVRERAEILMLAVNYGEVFGAILREHGLDRAAATMSAVQPLPIRLVDATPQRAVHAASVKAKYKLYYVDSFAAALAINTRLRWSLATPIFVGLGAGLRWFG